MIIKQLSNIDIARIREIDRTEHVTLGYVYADGDLKAEAVDWQIPRWKKDDPERGVEGRIRVWSPYLKNGGVLIGALEDDLLVGFIIFRPKLTETMAQLAVLHVSKDFRRRGIARNLTTRVIQLARESGATSLYVSATPSESAVGFYMSQGFKLAKEVHPELYAIEPEDIHMIKML